MWGDWLSHPLLGRVDATTFLARVRQKNETDPYLSPHTKTDSKWIKDPSVGPKTMKLLEENIGEMFQEIGIGKYFLGKSPKHRQPK
jgi:hypothetical protein